MKANSVTYTTRPAALDDCPGLAEVQIASYRTAYAEAFPPAYFAHFTQEEQTQDWRDWLTTRPESILWVAVSPAGQVLGYVLATAQPDVYPGFDSEIDALHVRQAFQRQGIGAALMKAAVGQLAKRQCRSVMLWTLQNNPIRKWYEQLGGKLLGEKRRMIDDWEVGEVAYGWETVAALQQAL